MRRRESAIVGIQPMQVVAILRVPVLKRYPVLVSHHNGGLFILAHFSSGCYSYLVAGFSNPLSTVSGWSHCRLLQHHRGVEAFQPQDCQWEEWNQWGACTRCDGEMIRVREACGKGCRAVLQTSTPMSSGNIMLCNLVVAWATAWEFKITYIITSHESIVFDWFWLHR